MYLFTSETAVVSIQFTNLDFKRVQQDKTKVEHCLPHIKHILTHIMINDTRLFSSIKKRNIKNKHTHTHLKGKTKYH